MLHLTTEVGKPGKNEFEKRHYPDLQNQPSSYKWKPSGRKFIDHGYCYMDDTLWRPHYIRQQPEFTDFGQDWTSRLRYIPHPTADELQRLDDNEIWSNTWFGLRTYPGHNRMSQHEWTSYPEGFHFGKVTSFDGIHKASGHGQQEVEYDQILGCSRKEPYIDKRNGLWIARPGDKPYRSVEYSPGFHRKGSTRPVVNFGQGAHKVIIPLEPLPPIKAEPYILKERRRIFLEEAETVKSLEDWRPATPLVPDVDVKVRS